MSVVNICLPDVPSIHSSQNPKGLIQRQTGTRDTTGQDPSFLLQGGFSMDGAVLGPPDPHPSCRDVKGFGLGPNHPSRSVGKTINNRGLLTLALQKYIFHLLKDTLDGVREIISEFIVHSARCKGGIARLKCKI
ncbi:hypothetical protein AVEN_103565-1 [Araneus ventricosus]|uniref:Uncharacterized protein n=1 Tax=Araneus ventricosus TaxID=182803 RepID=A0A4Y2G3U1_ARAVE|nr:hypothetical protein AVEN_103565-1 [Araneus ventricosus]